MGEVWYPEYEAVRVISHEIIKMPSLFPFSSSFFLSYRILVEVEESNTVVPSEMKETRRGNGVGAVQVDFS
jgi:hypothetical protein